MGRMVRRLRSPLPESLVADIESAGYLPAVVHDVVMTAVGRDQVVSHLVHAETTFDELAVRNHLTVLVLTDRRLVIAHADDHEVGWKPLPAGELDLTDASFACHGLDQGAGADRDTRLAVDPLVEG